MSLGFASVATATVRNENDIQDWRCFVSKMFGCEFCVLDVNTFERESLSVLLVGSYLGSARGDQYPQPFLDSY